MLAAVKNSFFPFQNQGRQPRETKQLNDDGCCISQNVGRTERNLIKSNN